ncbi:hypothetical protein CLV32_1556 [Pedobacter duraquae]|uniref:Uncharacterized protein n=1 Tax=Pedobacter duraquae TaxID=425511 RepID=A0A4R6IKH7_9SPHI|nr:hypothetical protein CLV32_1556 [Pedobacter duraquae]
MSMPIVVVMASLTSISIKPFAFKDFIYNLAANQIYDQ